MYKKIFLVNAIISSVLFANADYVGDKTCIECHAKMFKEWKGSQHDMSMMVANEHSVKADFNNTTFNYHGIISTFYKKNGKYMVQTDGPDEKLHEYEIAYTFGIYPLQQYMIKFPNGKIQVLDPTWDNRSKANGGQRWYHIHKDQNVTAGDVLHWTGANMNWNFMCADCHSTNLKKNYDLKTKTYHTTWSSINVSCESCHGPASKHLEWTKNRELNLTNSGFPISLKEKVWEENRTKSYRDKQINLCAKCHSRRVQLDDNFTPGDRFDDHYLASTLEDRLYFADGKIEDEVYVYDSFLQSEMYAQGVTCTDCHNPHTLKRKGVGDKVCFQCHTQKKYTLTMHHKHKEGSKGSSCISCHMPARTYMGVDSRNDHSFRVPRPDISVDMLNIPNACNLCHKDKDAKWSTEAMKKWYGKIPIGKQNFAHGLHALRINDKNASKSLYSILMSNAPDIAKATAVSYLGNHPSKQTYVTIQQMLHNANAQIRLAAIEALQTFPPQISVVKLFEMLDDPVKIVRTKAAQQLSVLDLSQATPIERAKIENAFTEYEKTLLFNADRPESQLSLGHFYNNKKLYKKAEKSYKESIKLQPQYVPAYINYSNFLVEQNRQQKAFNVLEAGLKNVPEAAILHHSLGLWYIRNKEHKKAIKELQKATELDSSNARFAYVYAVAIGKKNPQKAIKVLEHVYLQHTGDMQIVSGLVYYYKKIRDNLKTQQYEKKLKALENFSVK